jgi:hypothetical protein
MRRAVTRPLVVIVGASLLVVLLLGGGSASGATSANQYLRALERQTKALPAGTVTKKQLRRLTRTVVHARRAAKRKPCTSVRDLGRFRRLLRGIKVGSGSRNKRGRERLAALGPSSLKASQKLLSSSRTKGCGGGVRPSTLADTKTTVMQSDANGMRIRVELPVLRFVPETGGGQTWTKLVLPDTDSPGAPGTPGIPVVSNAFGVPDGATLNVQPGSSESYTITGVDVFPNQPDPVDQEQPRPDFLAPPFKQPPFMIDAASYANNATVPAQPADGAILGNMRDITIGNLQVPAAQYSPRSKTLKVLKSVEVNVTFEGGPHTFSDEIASPWEHGQRQFAASLLNSNLFRNRLLEIIRRCGEEMLVITNPATRVAADRFATAKRAQGMRTNVFETGAGAGQIGTTPAQIQAFIRGRLGNFFCIRPSYVTIMGDDDLVPTFAGINGIPSDLQYSMRDDADELPDLAVGRIIGNDQTAVGNAVNKIVNYETTPPTGPMLSRAIIAAQFQDDDNNGRENRTFIQFAETVRNGLVGRGVAVDRVYGEHPGNNPQELNDGTPLPAALKKPTFAWNGTGAQVSTAWNEGRFMVIHRDHGWSDGWGTPGYGTADVNALTNGANLPVVLSINCSSAAYDYDETSFVGEGLVKADGGLVGAFGDTRDSPTWHNTQIALGFVDGLLPSVLPGEGPAFKQRTGNALITGKLRLAGLAPPATDGSTRNELYLWHYFGDPSMQMWGGGSPPLVFDVSQFRAVYEKLQNPPGPDPPPYQVVLTFPAELAGQPISLLRNGDVVGKATAGAGPTAIPVAFGDGSVKPGDLQVVVDADGAVPVTIPVQGGFEKADTTLTQACPQRVDGFNGAPLTVSGKLEPSYAGATITIKYTTPSTPGPSRSFERTVTTNANGEWSNTIVPRDEEPSGTRYGNWTVQARFDGDSANKPSQAIACTVDVFNES